MSERPPIPAAVKREVLVASCHRCAVCGFGLSIELAHIIPWRETNDHSAANLIALCATCHTMADTQKWNSKDFEAYKQQPWALRHSTSQPMSAAQKAMVDLILARDAEDMGEFQRVQLVQIIAAYAGVMIADVRLVAVARSQSSLVRLELPRDAAEKLILGFQSRDPRLASFVDAIVGPSGSETEPATAPALPQGSYGAGPYGMGPYGGIKLIETARPTPAERPPVTNIKEEGLESLIVGAMTAFGWIAGRNTDYEGEYAVDLEQLTCFLEQTQEDVAAALDLRGDGPARRKFLAQLQGEISRRGTIDVLRKGIGHGSNEFRLFYGAASPETPNSSSSMRRTASASPANCTTAASSRAVRWIWCCSSTACRSPPSS